ncbi:MAG TPA: aminotransferase class IV [Waddliaceae bacterium]
MSIVLIDGQFLPLEEASLPVSSRGFLFGDGVFTSIRVKNGKIECLQGHLERLKQNCECLNILFPDIQLDKVFELVRRAKADQGIWKMKMIITGGTKADLCLTYRPHGHVIVMLTPYEPPAVPFYNTTVYPHSVQKPTASIKSLAYLDRLWIKEYARQHNMDDAITTTHQRVLLEAAFSNIFWCEKNNFYTPDPNLPLIKGISLSIMIEAAEKLNMKVHYVRNKLNDISEHANLFLSNAMIGFHPLVQVGERCFKRNLDFEKSLWQEREAIILETAVENGH